MADKTDVPTSAPLRGGVFELISGGGKPIGDTIAVGSDVIADFTRPARGTYFIHETKAPVGYQLAAHRYKIVISKNEVTLFLPSDDGSYPPTGKTVPLDRSDHAYHVTFADQKNAALPMAGGVIAAAPSAAGAGAIAFAGASLIRRGCRGVSSKAVAAPNAAASVSVSGLRTGDEVSFFWVICI